MLTGKLTNVSTNAWTKVTLDRAYTSMVVVATPNYAAGSRRLSRAFGMRPATVSKSKSSESMVRRLLSAA